jgi:hypothetical protein
MSHSLEFRFKTCKRLPLCYTHILLLQAGLKKLSVRKVLVIFARGSSQLGVMGYYYSITKKASERKLDTN